MIVDLLSPHPRTECVQRLQANVASEWALVTTLETVGVVDSTGFRIRKKIYYRNSFQQRLFGTLSDAPGGGTRIHGEIRELDLKWVLVAAAAFAGFAFVGTLAILYNFRAALHDMPLIAILAIALIAPLLVAIGVGAVAIGRSLARTEQQFLVDFVKRTLDAK